MTFVADRRLFFARLVPFAWKEIPGTFILQHHHSSSIASAVTPERRTLPENGWGRRNEVCHNNDTAFCRFVTATILFVWVYYSYQLIRYGLQFCKVGFRSFVCRIPDRHKHSHVFPSSSLLSAVRVYVDFVTAAEGCNFFLRLQSRKGTRQCRLHNYTIDYTYYLPGMQAGAAGVEVQRGRNCY